MKKTGIAFLILLLVLCVFHTGFAERIWVSVPGVAAPGKEPPVENISDDTHPNYLSLNNYHTSWQYWSQGASAVGPNYRDYACFMVAQSKLLVESGIESSSKTAFNPDIYYSRTCKLNNGDYADYLCVNYRNENGVYVDGYVKDHGGTISRLDDINLTGNNQTDAATIMEYINKGCYCILHRSGHHTYVWRQKSLELQTPVISDSSGDCSYWGGHCYELTSGNDTYNTLTPYRVSGGTNGVPGKEMSSGKARVLPDGDYVIKSAAATDKSKVMYLDIAGSAFPAANDTDVNIYECNSDTPSSYDVWTITYSDGFYTIKQKGAEIALDVWFESIYSGASIRAGTAHPSNTTKVNQKWAISRNGNNGYLVQAKISGYAMDIAGGSAFSGAGIVQNPVSGSASQSWLFVPYQPSQPVAAGTYTLVNAENTDYALNVQGGAAAADQTAVDLWRDSFLQNSAFELIKLTNGYYILKHSASEKVLEIYGGVSTYSSTPSVFGRNGSIAQQWAIIPQGTDSYRIVSKCNGYALSTAAGSSLTNGTAVYANPVNGNENQTWKFVKAGYTLHYTGGTENPEDQFAAGPEWITLSTAVPVWSGHVFKGWDVSIDAKTVVYRPGDEFYLCYNTTLYAVWEDPDPGVTVSCAVNGVVVPAGTVVGRFDVTVYGMGNYQETWSNRNYCIVNTTNCYRYEITNVTPAQGYRFDSAITGSLEGSLGESRVNVVLNFIPKETVTAELQILLEVDGESRETLEGVGSFDVRVTGTEVSVDEKQCKSFSGQYSEICDYEISNIIALYPYTCSTDRVTGTLINGITVVPLTFTRTFELQEEWQELDTLPDGMDMETCEVEYKNHYTYSGRTSPGEGWTLLAEGPVQYENIGDVYWSDEQLPVSESRVLVSRFYYHYCGSQKDNANWFQKSYLPTFHQMPAADFGKFNIVESGPDADPERGTRTYYLLRWNTGDNNGELAYCPSVTNGCGSACWYVMYVYQNRAPYQVNTYVRDSEWTSELDPEAASASVRVRLKHYPVFLDGNGGEPNVELEKIYGIDLDLTDYAPVQEGYLFTGWNTEADGTGIHYDADYVYTANETITLFAEWQAIDVVHLPAGIKRIEAEAFMGDTTIREVVVPESCEYIGEKAFAGCTQLKKIYIPQHTAFEDNAFMDCPQVVIIRTGDQ